MRAPGGNLGSSMAEWFRKSMEAGEGRRAEEAKALGTRAPAVPLPGWAGQAPSQPYAPPQLALGAPIGAVSPVQVNNQAIVDALRAPAAPQASGGNNG